MSGKIRLCFGFHYNLRNYLKNIKSSSVCCLHSASEKNENRQKNYKPAYIGLTAFTTAAITAYLVNGSIFDCEQSLLISLRVLSRTKEK